MAVFREMATSVRAELSDTIEVTVPTIADAEIDEVAVDVSGANIGFALAVGDAVVAVPMEALMTSAIVCGAYVSGVDEITVSFAAKEGGSGVTGAGRDFRFLCFDCTV